MKSLSRFSHCFRSSCLALALTSLTGSLHAQDFARMAEELDTDGEFLTYLDFRDDAAEFGRHLTEIYTAYLQSNPDAMPVPLDFSVLFNQIGIDSIGAVGFSSLELEENLFRNRGVLLLKGEPQGLLRLYDLSPRSFRAAQIAPADATLAVDFSLDLRALRDAVSQTAISIMGPLGQGMIEGSLRQKLTPSGLTGEGLIELLSHPASIVVRQSGNAISDASVEAYAEMSGAGALFQHLLEFSSGSDSGLRVLEVDGETVLDLSEPLSSGVVPRLYARQKAEDDGLILYTSEAFLDEIGAGETLAKSADFQTVAKELPDEAAAYSYQRHGGFEEILNTMRSEPAMAPYLPMIDQAIERLLGDFLRPTASAYYAIDGGIVTDSYAHYSTKEVIAAVPAALVGIAVAAIPAYHEFQANAEETAVSNNLRQIASAAQQFMLENDAAEVSFEELVGPGKYIMAVESVAGERYDHLTITADDEEISVELPDGRVVSHDF